MVYMIYATFLFFASFNGRGSVNIFERLTTKPLIRREQTFRRERVVNRNNKYKSNTAREDTGPWVILIFIVRVDKNMVHGEHGCVNWDKNAQNSKNAREMSSRDNYSPRKARRIQELSSILWCWRKTILKRQGASTEIHPF